MAEPLTDRRSDPPAYDSRPDTYEHIAKVRKLVQFCAIDLLLRGDAHDASKLEEPELSMFDQFTARLGEMSYGSAEYKATTDAMKQDALDHHYACNDHHPEHHEHGIKDMNLLNLLEMLCDWTAASSRHADGDPVESVYLNAARFGYGEEITRLLLNTLDVLPKP